ncbi:MAG: DinB family protein [Thermoanaerobaculia bacterium]|nr:DinB family protein [Thermoanaerobaculia bacterium]
MVRSKRPGAEEYDPFYDGYIQTVPDGDIVDRLASELDSGLTFYGAVPKARRDYRYSDDKWTLREVLGHVLDTERIFSYRSMCIARGDQTALPGMDQDEYMAGADFGRRSWDSLMSEYEHLRRANLALVSSFGETELQRRGTASGLPISVRALVWILAGHEMHHRNVIQERYLAD